MPDSPIIDNEAIDNLRDLNPGDNGEFLREIIGIYIEDTPKRIEELKRSHAAGDAPTFTRAAHTIKGSSANVGAASVRAVAEKLEHLGKSGNLTAAAGLLADCDAQFELARGALNKIAAEG